MDRHLQLRVLQTRSQGTCANLISRPFFAYTLNLLMISKNWCKEKIIGTLWHPRHSPSQISYGRLQEKIWSFAQRTENSLPLQRVSRLQKAFEWVHGLFWLVPITKPIFLWIYQQFWLVPITKRPNCFCSSAWADGNFSQLRVGEFSIGLFPRVKTTTSKNQICQAS